MTDYTPTTDRVRHCATRGDAWLAFQPESFDRWLDRHDAEIRNAALEEARVIAVSYYDFTVAATIHAAKVGAR